MKFVCEKSILLKEISIAQEIIASKNVISILSNIYLCTENDSLVIKATDMKVYFETRVPVTVVEQGYATVFGDKFFGIINSAPEGNIEFECVENKIKIKISSKKASFNLKSMAMSESFPEFPVTDKEYFDFSIKDFKYMVNQTIFSISDDETRYNMLGVYLEKADNKLTMVTTNGKRLAYIENESNDIADFSGILIPPKILNIITKRAGDEGLIAISITEKIIYFRFGSYNLSSVLIEGNFPNYKKVIPEDHTNSIIINKIEMLDALKRVSLMVEQKAKRLFFKARPGIMEIYTEEGEIGEARQEISCEYEGEETVFALNYIYIEEPIKAMDSEKFCINFTVPSKAITIVSVPETNFFYIVMPMHY